MSTCARLVCIGIGPGPKNVLVEFEDGSRTVVPYAIWKHKLSKQQGGPLADKYLVAAGFVQKFGEKPAVTTAEVNGENVRRFTIKTVGSQKLIGVTVWEKHAAVPVKGGDFVAVEGKHTVSGDQGQFHNLSASQFVVLSSVAGEGREVVNQSQASGGSEDSNPF